VIAGYSPNSYIHQYLIARGAYLQVPKGGRAKPPVIRSPLG